MIQPPPGVRATAEPVRESAEHPSNPSESFHDLLNAASSATPAQGDDLPADNPRKELPRGNRDDTSPQPPTHLGMIREELMSRGPVKASTAAAMQEATSPTTDAPEPTARSQLDARADTTTRSAPHSNAATPSSSNNTPAPSPSVASSATPATRNAPKAHASASNPSASPAAKGTPAPAAAAPPPQSATSTAAAQPALRTQAPTSAAARPFASPAPRHAQAPKTPAPARAPSPPHPPDVQFARGLAAALRQGGGTVTLHLKPETLGDLKIRLHIDRGSVEARFEARTEEARALLNQSIDSLKAALEAKGLDVERLTVLTAERNQHTPAQDAHPQDAAPHGDPRHGSHRHGRRHHAARTPQEDQSTELLTLPPALMERSASLGGAARLDAIA